ncbi:hypothetical protein ACET3Z_008637 [Daucus carota]
MHLAFLISTFTSLQFLVNLHGLLSMFQLLYQYPLSQWFTVLGTLFVFQEWAMVEVAKDTTFDRDGAGLLRKGLFVDHMDQYPEEWSLTDDQAEDVDIVGLTACQLQQSLAILKPMRKIG